MMGFGFQNNFFLFFGVIVVIIVAQIVMGIAKWSQNNGQPVIERDATIVAKRAKHATDLHHHTNSNGHAHVIQSTTHYATFQFSDGSREEFCISGSEYGMLAEGDRGTLISQGTRFNSFMRL